MSRDDFTTPEALAGAMVSAVRVVRPDPVVADFAAGEGELLRAGKSAWPAAHLVGTDIDLWAVNRLRSRFDCGRFGSCDFLNTASRLSCSALRAPMQADVVLLNPPFTCRGARRYVSEFSGTEFGTGQALAFLISALSYLADDGELVAILPSSTTSAQRDRDAWRWLAANRAEVIRTCDRRAFSGAVVDSVIVRIGGRPSCPPEATRPRYEPGSDPVERGQIDLVIFRGKLPRHAAKLSVGNEGLPFIHTTDVGPGSWLRRGGNVDLSPARVLGAHAQAVRGPCVLIPRVGSPYSLDPVLLPGTGPFVMSDCLFALRAEESIIVEHLYRRLKLNWSEIASGYAGSGAKYVTLERLAELLSGLGYRSTVAAGGDWLGMAGVGAGTYAL